MSVVAPIADARDPACCTTRAPAGIEGASSSNVKKSRVEGGIGVVDPHVREPEKGLVKDDMAGDNNPIGLKFKTSVALVVGGVTKEHT